MVWAVWQTLYHGMSDFKMQYTTIYIFFIFFVDIQKNVFIFLYIK